MMTTADSFGKEGMVDALHPVKAPASTGTRRSSKAMATILAVSAWIAGATAANADLLASWGSGGIGADLDWMSPYDGYHIDTGELFGVKDLEPFNGATMSAGSGSLVELAGLDLNGGAGFCFNYIVYQENQATETVISGVFQADPDGPARVDWFVNDLTGPAVASVDLTGSQATSFSSPLGTLVGAGTIYLVADPGAGTAGGSSSSPGGSLRLLGDEMQLNGIYKGPDGSDNVIIPEPATLGLLLLGALPLAWRRRK